MDPNLALAIAAFIGAAAGSAGTIFVNARIADKEHQEQRRKERSEFILHAIQALVHVFAQYEEFIQQAYEPAQDKASRSVTHARIIGQAIGEMLAVDDRVLMEIATERLTPNMVEEKDDPSGFAKYGAYKTRNRDALIDAIKQLGKLMRDTTNSGKLN